MELHGDTPEARVATARTAVLIATVALAWFFGIVVLSRWFGWFAYPLEPTLALFAVLIGGQIPVLLTVERWAGLNWVTYAYEGAIAIIITVILHYLGGLTNPIYIISYAFSVIHTQIVRSDASAFVTANFCAVLYAILAWVEASGIAPPPRVIDARPTASQQLSFVLVGVLTFNLLALFVDRYGYQLRHLAAHLQRLVGERTAELTTANRELHAKARELEAKQEELRGFVYTVTHDLKNPLSATLLTADMLLEREGQALSAAGRADLERIVRLASSTEDMIRDLLELFRIASAPEGAQWVDLGEVTAHALDTLRPLIAAKQVQVSVGDLPAVWGQAGKLGHVVTNLLSNAVKYVPAHGGRVDVEGVRTNGTVRFRVRDNGIGIAPEYHEGIFALFGRVPAPEQVVDGQAVAGTGVGLAIVQRIVDAHGGRVWVDSAPGAGATFHVELPGREGVAS